jgi:hypothetical protein
MLLDVLAESYKPEDLLDSANWSDSELEDAEEGGLFASTRARYFVPSSEESDGGDGGWEESEDEVLAGLEAEYQALLHSAHMDTTAAATSMKRSPSKHANPQPVKARRSYKFLPTDEAGAVEYPVVLGRGLNRISISSIGTVVDEPGHLESSEDGSSSYIYPVGYECKRKYLDWGQDEAAMASLDSTQPALKQAYYYCQVAPGPVFRILVRDGHNGTGENVLFSDEDASLAVLWERFVGRFTEALADQLREDFGRPQAFFGFHHENLQKYLEEQLVAARKK